MRRSLLHFLRFASLLLCIASLILWHRSYRTANGYAWQNADGSQSEIVSYAGGLQIRKIRPQISLIPITPARRNIAEPIPANANWQTRAGGFTNQVLWQRAGFVLLAGHTQTLTLTGSGYGGGYNLTGISGTINTSFATNGTVTLTPINATNAITLSTPRVNTGGILAGSSIVFPIDSTQLLLIIPWWFIAVLGALLPASTLLRTPLAVRTYRRRKLGLCIHCGYDLRSSSDRCPECGQST